ncbi:cadherin-17 [Scomber scombrus]|uniref:cadherin-17 n=1 Tax=Scomber scombrus TaxID=13677 RepID=UPI002DD96C71|nr:cadherin-17 [Scomber scombrus]
MTPKVHLLLLPLLFSIAGGIGLEDKKGLFKDMELTVQEETPVPYAMFQFEVTQGSVNNFRLSGENSDAIKISKDGWLYLDAPLKWSENNLFNIKVEALADDEVVEGPIHVALKVLDINNNAPYFNQSVYSAMVKENNPAGVPFTRVFASDQDDPETPNAHLMYSLVSQTPSRQSTPLFQIDPNTGEISTTKEGEKMLKARDAFQYGRGQDQSIDALKTRFNDYCPEQGIPFEENPFFTCVQRSEMRRQNVDPLNDPDYTLFVRVQDQGGATQTALSGNTRVQIVIKQNLWVNPGPILVKENLKAAYPHVIAKVQSNDPNAVYRLVQKERELKFPFQITVDGEIQLTEDLDREEKGQYIMVVLAEDEGHNQVDPPMEIQVIVEDVNDNMPVCEENVFEVQEDEPAGSLVNKLVAHDDDQEGTVNSLLMYAIESQEPSSTPTAFSIDAASGEIKTLRLLRRRDQQVYNLNVRVNDLEFSTVCKVVIKVIDVNNEIPKFEKNDYGSLTLQEDTAVGHTVLTIKATDADDPDSGSSFINFQIRGDNDDVFTVETDGKGVGHVVIAKPLDFESTFTYNLQIDARNPEPLMKGIEYGIESTASVTVSVTDVDEAPEFSLDILDVTVPENTTKGTVLLTVEAKDPEGKAISFKLDGDTQGWLEINAATGEIKTKDKLDRETLEAFEVIVIAFEKEHPEKSAERTVSVRLLDVNDNVPKLKENQAFICVVKPEPVIIKAHDADSPPFSQPFIFSLAHGKKSPNWNLQTIDGTTAKLTLKKTPTEDKTFIIPINVKDNAGMGITHSFEVRVCNCTELGYCYVAPAEHSFKYGMGTTIGILAGTIGFCIIAFIIVVKRSNKGGKRTALTEDGERNPMM